MSGAPEGSSATGRKTEADSAERAAEKVRKAQHDHDDERVDEWEEESFPASDPPSNY